MYLFLVFGAKLGVIWDLTKISMNFLGIGKPDQYLDPENQPQLNFECLGLTMLNPKFSFVHFVFEIIYRGVLKSSLRETQ